ncbi:hypothetical protein LguiB_028049 [Lonicera macranthoides]
MASSGFLHETDDQLNTLIETNNLNRTSEREVMAVQSTALQVPTREQYISGDGTIVKFRTFDYLRHV